MLSGFLAVCLLFKTPSLSYHISVKETFEEHQVLTTELEIGKQKTPTLF